MPRLQLVMAGAGAGKTENIRQRIAAHIAAGHDPARVIATTYTRNAAAELKGRIQAATLQHPKLSAADRIHKAERLELAPIGTVHSVGFQLASRYAIALGISPRLEVTEEDGQHRSLRELMGLMDNQQWEQLIELGRRLSLDSIDKLVLKLLDAKRGNCIDDEAFSQQMSASANRLCQILSATGTAKHSIGFARLAELAQEALTAIQGLNDETKVTKDAVAKLRAMALGGVRPWREFLDAAKLEAGKTSGANGCLTNLRAAGAAVRTEAGLHADIREFLKRLTELTLALDAAYANYKSERGLVDFTDLELLFLRLLTTSELQESLREEFDLIAVDEFQDTNPLQLAIFERLKDLSAESHWVGDPKQAIFGFRGTDPELIQAVWDNIPPNSQQLIPSNHRSQKGLVQLVGRLFVDELGASAQQEPVRPTSPRGIERWLFQTKNKTNDWLSLAVGVAQLRNEGTRLRDIAVLVRTNDEAKYVGAALQELKIPALLELPGLLSTREGSLVMAGLRLVADRYDSLAAATVMHFFEDPTTETPGWLAQRLEEVQRSRDAEAEADSAGKNRPARIPPWHDDPSLTALTQIDPCIMPPSLVVQLVIDSLGLGECIRRWGETARRASNLDALVNLARSYEDNSLDAGAAATLTGFITHLEHLADLEKDTRLPPLGIEAVTLVTYHKAKGREWPVVILAGLDFEREADLWSPEVTGGTSQKDEPLQGRTLRYWPWPFGRNPRNPVQLITGSSLEIDARNTNEGQHAQQRGDTERLRLLYVGFTRAKDKLVLAHRQGDTPWLQMLRHIDTVLDPSLQPGEHSLENIETTYVVRHLKDSMVASHAQSTLTEERWLKPLQSPNEVAAPIDRFHSPSLSLHQGTPPAVQLEGLPGQPIFPHGYGEGQEGPLGDAVHGYLAALPSLMGLSADRKRAVALRCLSGHGVEGLLAADTLIEFGERLTGWIQRNYPTATWHTEVPVVAPRAAGGQWLGNIDLLLRLPDGSAVIIDHKSAPLRRASCAAKAQSFAGQIDAYQQCIESQGLRVANVWIHFPLAAVMAQLSG